MKSLLIFSTLLVCALAYRVVPNMNHGSIKPDYLAKCVNASIVAIESYDMDGNNGLSYEEIKDVSFGAKIQSQIFFLKNLKKNVKIETKKPKIKRKYFRYNLNFSSNFFLDLFQAFCAFICHK